MTIPSPRARNRVRIEIIPLIDIIFFLLATFVMVSLSMVRNKGVPVTLPAARSATSEAPPEFATLTITKEGTMLLDKEPVAPAELSAKLAALKTAAQGDPRVLINGDEEAPLGHAIRVLDECRLLQIEKVTFQTRPRGE